MDVDAAMFDEFMLANTNLVGAMVKVLRVQVDVREVGAVEVEVEGDGRENGPVLHVADLHGGTCE